MSSENSVHLSRIARDEARHADLAWAIDAELQARLTSAERSAVEAARQAAVAALRQGLADSKDELQRGAGLPNLAQATTLLERANASIWQQAA